MKRNLAMMMLATASLSLMPAAQGVTVKGIVRDMTFDERIPYATVRIYNAADTLPLSTLLTDTDGGFSVSFDGKGDYLTKTEYVGKLPEVVSFTVNDNDSVIDLGVIDMRDNVSVLGEVEVAGMRPIVKAEPDKISYSVKDDSDSKTYTLLDMLRKVPMVSVDGEDNITVNGFSNFKVYVNGMPSVAFSADPGKIFKSMPATLVKNIEVVTSPGARYDAEGAGGILNLVMETADESGNLDGYNATIGIHGGSKGGDGSISMTGQTNKLSYSGNITHNITYPGNSEVAGQQKSSTQTIKTHSTGLPHINFTMGNVSADYAVDANTNIGISASVTGFVIRSDGNIATELLNPSHECVTAYTSAGDMDINRYSTNGSLSVNHDFAGEKDASLSFIYQITGERNKMDSEFGFSASNDDYYLDLSDRTSRNRENTTYNIFQTDFSIRPREEHTLDTGVKLTMKRSHSNSVLDYMDAQSTDQDTRYNSSDNILAAYTEYAVPLDKVKLKAGVRYEHTWQKMNFDATSDNSLAKSYGTFVPSVALAYNLSSTSNIGLTYNMRIARPGISYMNPYIDRSDPTSISYGNPYLSPEKIHNIGLSYNLFTPRLILNTRLSDGFTANGIEQYRFLTDGLLTTTYGNVAKRNNLRLDASATWMASVSTRLFINGSAGYVSLSNRQMHLRNSGWQWNLTAGLQHTLPYDIKASAYLIASSKSYTIEGWNSGFKMLSANLSKSFLDNRLSVSASLNTGLSKGGRMIMENYSRTSEFESHNIIRVPMLSAAVGVSYTLGSYEPKQSRNRKAVESDYMEQKSDMESIPLSGNIN